MERLFKTVHNAMADGIAVSADGLPFSRLMRQDNLSSALLACFHSSGILLTLPENVSWIQRKALYADRPDKVKENQTIYNGQCMYNTRLLKSEIGIEKTIQKRSNVAFRNWFVFVL